VSNKVNLAIVITILILILSLICISCTPSKSSKPSKFLTYTDKANGFSIDYPEGWYIKHPKKPPQLKVAIFSKKYGINPVGILVGKYRVPGYNLKSFSEYRIDHLSNNTKDFNFISTEELTVNDMKAIKHTYTRKVGQTKYKSVEICLVENGIGWIINCNSPLKTFDSNKPIFDTVLNSFSLSK
jgi:hypothetical protein